MADNVTNELLLDHLKSIQSRLSSHDERFNRLESDIRAIKAHLARLVQSDLTRDADHAGLLTRVERIEHRLEIRDNRLSRTFCPPL